MKNSQNYKPSYEYEDLLKLFQEFSLNIERFIDEIKPNIIIGFSPTTLGEYLFVKIAKQKKIPYHILRSVKLKNYQTFTMSMFEEYHHIQESYNSYSSSNNIEQTILIEAKKYLLNFDEGSLAYEGNVKTPEIYQVFKLMHVVNYFKFLAKDILTIIHIRDNHNRELYSLRYLYDYPIRNYKIKYLKGININRTIYKINYIKNNKYIFYPLHAEPEIAISNFSRRYQNQIEVIRNIALQMPVDYKLLVKEHPRNIGRRGKGYYEKILRIPNVDFANFELPSIEIVRASRLVIVLSGNIGFEAVLSQVPVISFGSAIYNMLPTTMVNHLSSMNNLHFEITNTIESYKYSKDEILKYISAIIANSFSLDLYTVLLKKDGREGGVEFNVENYNKNIEIFSSKIYQLFPKKIH